MSENINNNVNAATTATTATTTTATATTTTGGRNEKENTELKQLSYEEIIECIQENKEVPNMIDVPDIVLSSDMISKSSLPIRHKPWELKTEETTTATTTSANSRNTAATEVTD